MISILSLLHHYYSARRLRFKDRPALEAHQARALSRHLDWLAAHSPYYASYAGLPLAQWPMVDKVACLKHFDTMNTAGLQLATVQATALRAECERDFSPTVGQHTVGLSSGTSGKRGVFVASPAERAKWAGLILAKLLPEGFFRRERIAFFLRANSNLYKSVQTPWIGFRFFDLTAAFEPQLEALTQYQPSIIVAPAQVLRAFALAQREGRLAIAPKRVISVAEVLEPGDRQLIESLWVPPSEVYQATEGFLGCTCSHGNLHLNEEYLHIEPEWLDADKTRMVPIITDFTRTTQPIIRYRLNDVLAVRKAPCPCGNPTLTLAHIEGRCDDQLQLPAQAGGQTVVFADAISRALLRALPLELDYRLTQTGARDLLLACPLEPAQVPAVLAALGQALEQMGVNTSLLKWDWTPQLPVFDPSAKRRRIIRSMT